MLFRSKLMWDHKEGTAQYRVELVTGQTFLIDARETLSTPGMKLANQGYRSFKHDAALKADHGVEEDDFRERVFKNKNHV